MRRAPYWPLVFFAASVLISAPTQAQDNQGNDPAKQAAPSINYRERPKYTFDSQRLKRKPTIDGTIGDSEWDALYTVTDGPAKGTVYVNWDDDFIYVATKTDEPAWTVIDLDVKSDGWLHGADNLELTIGPLAGGSPPVVTARVLDAASGKDSPEWNAQKVDPKTIQIAGKTNGSGQVIELAIPKGTLGLAPKVDGMIGFRADFLPASATPTATAPYEPHLLVELRMVESRISEVPGIGTKITLEDNRVIPGQTLKATLDLTGKTDDQFQVKSIMWKGEGPAGDILRLLKDPSAGTVTLKKPLKLSYSATIPVTAPPGTYQITAAAELEGGKIATATTSFEVVEPFVLTLSTQPANIIVAGTTKFRIIAEIENSAPGYVRGGIELEVPAGWIVEGRQKKSFEVAREDSVNKEQFFVTLPSNTATGDYLVHCTLSWKGKTWKAHKTVHITGGGTAAPAETKPPKK